MIDFENETLENGLKKYPHWVKLYLEKGFAVFSPDEIALLRRMKAKYEQDFVLFISSLIARLKIKGKPQPGREELIQDLIFTRRKIKELVEYIGDLLGEKKRPASAEEIKGLFETMLIINQKMKQYQELAEADSVLREKIVQAKEKTGVSLENVVKVTELSSLTMKRMVPKMTIKERAAKFKEMAPEAYGLYTGLKSAALTAFLGPFAQLGELAWKTIRGIQEKRREKKISAERERFAAETLLGKEYTPEALREAYEELKVRGKPLRPYLPTVEREGVKPKVIREKRRKKVAEEAISEFKPEIVEKEELPKVRIAGTKEELAPEIAEKLGLYKMAGVSEAKVPKMSLGKIPAVSSANVFLLGLTNFFNKFAYQTRWTKEVLDSLKKISAGIRTGKGGLGDILNTVMSKITSFGSSLLGIGRTLFGGYGALGGASGIMGVLSGLAKGGLWGGLIKGGASLLGRIPALGGLAGFLGRFAGPIGWGLTALQAGMGAFKGVRAAGEIFGTERATLGQKIAAGFGGALESLTFGLLKKENIARFSHSLASGIAESFKAHPFKTAFAGLLGPLGPLLMGLRKAKELKGETEPIKEEISKREIVKPKEKVKKKVEWWEPLPREEEEISKRDYKSKPVIKTEPIVMTGYPTVREMPEVPRIETRVAASFRGFDDTLKRLVEEVSKIKTGAGAIPVKKVSESDFYNTKDSILELLNLGNLGVKI